MTQIDSIDSTDTALRLAIVRRAFSTRRRGYDPVEVDELLDTVTTLADDLLREAGATARHGAEAEAELVGTRAEVRELREVTAATEQLLASTRAELRTERLAAARDCEAEEKLVVAEAELRLARASAEGTEQILIDTRLALEAERAARTVAEAQAAELQAEMTALAADRARDPFAEVGAEIATVLRAAAEAAEVVRERASLEADAVLSEADELAAAVLQDAEAKIAAAEQHAGQSIELAAAVLEDAEAKIAAAEQRAGPSIEHAVSESLDPDDAALENDVRRELEAAVDSLLQAAGEPMADLRPFAMEANGANSAN